MNAFHKKTWAMNTFVNFISIILTRWIKLHSWGIFFRSEHIPQQSESQTSDKIVKRIKGEFVWADNLNEKDEAPTLNFKQTLSWPTITGKENTKGMVQMLSFNRICVYKMYNTECDKGDLEKKNKTFGEIVVKETTKTAHSGPNIKIPND